MHFNLFEVTVNMLKSEDIISRLMITEEGFKSSSDRLFKNDGKYFPEYVKKGVIAVEDEEQYHLKNQIFCNVPGCKRFFQSVFAYQSHYNSLHRYICNQCKKSLPTPHLLDLHLSENHDSYFLVVSKSKPMYSCFIEECAHKCNTPEERKDHCISSHKFPPNFRFENLYSVDKKAHVVTEAEVMTDEPMDGKKAAFTNKKFNFSFGHTKSKTFNKKNYAKLLCKTDGEYKNSLEDSQTVSDLLSSLPE